MKDIQKQKDKRGVHLDRVGITKISLPLLIPGTTNKQQVTATISFFADLDHTLKAHHMSRFAEVLFKNHKTSLTFKNLKLIASEAKERLQAKNVYFDISFKYFIKKTAPVSKKISLSDYECGINLRVSLKDSERRLIVNVPVMLLCPCSKAISKHNAHNQRSIIKVDAVVNEDMQIDELIKLVEGNGSSEIYTILKRTDEKYITEASYENPKFVEDAVRDTVLTIKKNKRIKSVTVECESLESIHNHNAYARYSSTEDNES